MCLPASHPASLPVIGPGSYMSRPPDFLHIIYNCAGFMSLLLHLKLIYLLHHLDPLLAFLLPLFAVKRHKAY